MLNSIFFFFYLMKGGCDGRPLDHPANLKQQFVEPGYSETTAKRRRDPGNVIGQKHWYLRFSGTKWDKSESAIKNNLKTVEAKTVTDRICILTIEKREKLAVRENRKSIFKTNIKKNRLVLINCYATHMGITAKDPEETEILPRPWWTVEIAQRKRHQNPGRLQRQTRMYKRFWLQEEWATLTGNAIRNPRQAQVDCGKHHFQAQGQSSYGIKRNSQSWNLQPDRLYRNSQLSQTLSKKCEKLKIQQD